MSALSPRAAVGCGIVGLSLAAIAYGAIAQNDTPLECAGGAIQGGIVLCETAPNARIEVNGATRTRADDQGRVTLGVQRDAEGALTVQAFADSGESAPLALPIADSDYAFSVVPGLDCSQVSVFTQEQLDEIGVATEKKNRSVATFAEGLGAHAGFRLPSDGPRSSPFGTRRRLEGVQSNGEVCSKVRTHWGLDLAVPTGTPILAPAPGVVTLADGLYFEGNAVFLDHGHGLQSVFMHLSEIDVEEGQAVAAGELLGKVGMTGTATGPHLHWGIKVRNTETDDRSGDFYVDPALALELAAEDAG